MQEQQQRKLGTVTSEIDSPLLEIDPKKLSDEFYGN